MSGKKIAIVCGAMAIVALVVAFTFAPGQVDKVLAQAATVVYNLRATDAYIELPDGLPLYIYGFIGDRQDALGFTYQQSCVPQDDPVTDAPIGCSQPGNVTTLGDAPTPTAGVWSVEDSAFAGNAQYPAPIIYATVGDVVEIRLKNLGVKANPLAPNDPHSIHLHGLDVDAANDGVPETSVAAVPANLCLDGSTADPATGICDPVATGGPAPGAGNVIVYMFSPVFAGTYMYHCHQEADIHVQMGMYGALVVYNVGDAAALVGPGQGAGGKLFKVAYDKDYVMLLSEFDVRGHQDEEGTYVPASWDPDPFNWALYKPQYWQINGISFPNTIHAGWPSLYTYADWLLAHPGYETLYTGSVSVPNLAWGTPGHKVLLRVINMGFETHPLHMHGYHGKIIGSDQRGWDWASTPPRSKTGQGVRPFGEGLEKNTLLIGSGETYEWLVDFGQQTFQSTYPAGTESRYYDGIVGGLCEADILAAGLPVPALNTPVSNTFVNCPAIPEAGVPGSPTYIGGPTVTGAVGIPAATQFFPFHNHDDYKATNNGVYPGGMFTMLVPTP